MEGRNGGQSRFLILSKHELAEGGDSPPFAGLFAIVTT
jgi:hypothetical protein